MGKRLLLLGQQTPTSPLLHILQLQLHGIFLVIHSKPSFWIVSSCGPFFSEFPNHCFLHISQCTRRVLIGTRFAYRLSHSTHLTGNDVSRDS